MMLDYGRLRLPSCEQGAISRALEWRDLAGMISPTPRKQIIFGGDGISTTTQLIPGYPTYRYSVMCSNGSKRIEVIWYDDAQPVYAGIYDVFQKMAEQVEFNRYAEGCS